MVDIISKPQLKTLLSSNTLQNLVIISIGDSFENPEFKFNWPEFGSRCELMFDDVEPDSTFPNAQLISEGQAEDIVEFAQQHTDSILLPDKTFYVQCTGGVSRSAAVAAAICHMLPGIDDWFIFNDPKYCPNKYVYLTVLKAAGIYPPEWLLNQKFHRNEMSYWNSWEG